MSTQIGAVDHLMPFPVRRRDSYLPGVMLAAMFVALVAPVILSGRGGTAGARDEAHYHLPTIRALARELPSPDLKHINTATGPGYHLAVSVFDRLVTDNRIALQAFASLFSLALILVVYALFRRYAAPWIAAIYTVPLLLSSYFLQSAGWLTTDNTAVLFVTLAIGAALTITVKRHGFGKGGLWACLAVWVRQIDLWATGPLVLSGAVAGRLVRLPRDQGGKRDTRPLLLIAAAIAPAMISVAVFFAIWGGLTPPAFPRVAALRPAAVPFTLALVGAFGPFFVVGLPELRELLRGRGPVLAAIVGGLVGAAVPTTAGPDGRTGGGLWKAVAHAPVVADRSVLVIGLSALGGLILLVLWRRCAARGLLGSASVLFFAIAALAAAQSTTTSVYQRYFEPMLLILLALLLLIGTASRDTGTQQSTTPRKRMLVALGLLSAVQLVGAVVVVYGPMLGSGSLPP